MVQIEKFDYGGKFKLRNKKVKEKKNRKDGVSRKLETRFQYFWLDKKLLTRFKLLLRLCLSNVIILWSSFGKSTKKLSLTTDARDTHQGTFMSKSGDPERVNGFHNTESTLNQMLSCILRVGDYHI